MPDEFNIPEDPFLPDDCPIAELLGKRVSEMNDDELAKYTMEMRSVIETPQAMRKLLANHGTAGPKKRASTAKPTVKPDLGLLGAL